MRIEPRIAHRGGRGGQWHQPSCGFCCDAAGGGPAHLELRFRIGGQLAYFTREYDSSNEAHDLRIGFANAGDLEKFRELALPHLLQLAKSTACSSGSTTAAAGTKKVTNLSATM